jgi:hypothetical protein
LWEVLWLRLALWLLRAFCVLRVARISVGRRAVIRVLRLHRALVHGEGWSSARIVLCLRAAIVAIHRLADGRRALHHVGRLRRHCRSALRRPHLRLRCHCLGAAGHGWTGAEYVGKGRVSCSPGRPIRRTPKLAPLLVAVVGHVHVRSVLDLLAHPRVWEMCKTFCAAFAV